MTTAAVDEVAARRLAKLSEETRELLELGWWWLVEENPTCVDWCSIAHEPDEFSEVAILICRHVTRATEEYTIEATYSQAAETGRPGTLVHDSSVDVVGRLEYVAPGEVLEVCRALKEAAEIVQRGGSGAGGGPLSPDLEAWASWMRRQGLSENTIRQRLKFARRFDAWGGWDATGEDLAVWLDGYAGWTRGTYQNHLASLYRWLVETGQRTESPIKDLRPATTPGPRPRPLTPRQVEVVMAAASGPLLTWMELALFAGLRAHEIAKIRGADVTAESVLIVGKGRRVGKVPTHPRVWEIARRYPRDGYWFPSPFPNRDHLTAGRITQAVRRHFDSLGLDGSIHRLRATYGTELLRAGVNLRVIQDLMRHRSLTSTEHYLGVTEEERTAAVRTLDRFWVERSADQHSPQRPR